MTMGPPEIEEALAGPRTPSPTGPSPTPQTTPGPDGRIVEIAFAGVCAFSALTLVVCVLRCVRKRCKRDEISRRRTKRDNRTSARTARTTGTSYYSIMDDGDEISLAEDWHRKQGPSKRPTESDSSAQSTPRSGEYPTSDKSDSSEQSDFSTASRRGFWMAHG